MSRLLVLLLLLPLAACLLPNSYDAEVVIHQDGRYTARFEGDLLFVPARREMKDADAATIDAAFAAAIAPMTGVVATEAKGDAVWHVRIVQEGVLQPGGNALPGPDRFLILNRKGGETMIGTPDLSPQHRKQLAGYGPSAGRLCIRTDATVLAHNADAAPSAENGCFLWQLDVLGGKRVDMRLGL